MSCATHKKTDQPSKDVNEALEVLKPEFQTIIDEYQVVGSVLIYDLEQNTYYSNDFDWTNRGFLPASTFKISNSIIALDLGIVEQTER